MVGFHTVAQQGQPLGYTTRFSDVIWACILVPAGRFVVSLDRQGISKPALIGGGIGFLYLFGVGMLGISGSLGYDTFPHPFDEPMVNIIFGLGALFISAAPIRACGTAGTARRPWSCARHAKHRARNWARRMSASSARS